MTTSDLAFRAGWNTIQGQSGRVVMDEEGWYWALGKKGEGYESA